MKAMAEAERGRRRFKRGCCRLHKDGENGHRACGENDPPSCIWEGDSHVKKILRS